MDLLGPGCCSLVFWPLGPNQAQREAQARPTPFPAEEPKQALGLRVSAALGVHLPMRIPKELIRGG